MSQLRMLTLISLLALVGLLSGGAISVAAQGDVGVQHTSPAWHGTYYNNATLTEPAVFERDDPTLNFNWGGGSPEPGALGNDYFSVRWTRYLDVTPGTYRFTASSDDGIRVTVDGRVIIDGWSEHPVQTYTGDIALSAGHHLVVVEYFELQGGAQVAVDWAPVSTAQNGFLGQYFPNRDLSGAPVTTRNDQEINFDWGYSSPFAAAFGNDNFSIRWTRVVTFDPATYRFYVTADDGARLWVNGHLLIDAWHDQSATTYSGDIYLSGPAEVKMEYYEHGGAAVAKMRWEKNPGQTPPPPPPGQTTVYLVQRGDTLSAIARRFGTTVQAIMSANGLNSTLIYVGQRLIIPLGGQTPPPPTYEVVVDNTDPGFSLYGPPSSWRTAGFGYGNTMLWTLNNTNEVPNYNYARWTPRLAAGRYEVFVFVPSRNASTTNAVYWVTHADGVTPRSVNQLAYSNQWVSVGTYRFSGNGNERVSLSDITGEPYLSVRIGFDAVRWVPR